MGKARLNVRIDPVMHMLGFMALFERGYFREKLGLDMTFYLFASDIDLPGNVYEQLDQGEIDVTATGITTMHLDAASEGLDFKTVASRGELTEDASGWVLLVGAERFESGDVRTTNDLAGKTVGLPGLKGNPAYGVAGKPAYPVFMMVKDLKQNGLVQDDLKEVLVGQPPEILKALSEGRVDAAWLQPGLADAAVDSGVGVMVKRDFDVSGRMPLGVISYSGKFIRDNRELGHTFMKGYLESVKFLAAGADPVVQPELAAAAEKYLFLSPDILGKLPGTTSWPNIPADGHLSLDLIEKLHKESYELGLVENPPVPVETWVDTSFTTRR